MFTLYAEFNYGSLSIEYHRKGGPGDWRFEDPDGFVEDSPEYFGVVRRGGASIHKTAISHNLYKVVWECTKMLLKLQDAYGYS